MIAKLSLYANTIKSMRASQIYCRIRKMLKLDCSIGCTVSSNTGRVEPIATVSELDFDLSFLERFSADEILADKITFLHTSKEFHWNQRWHFDDKSALWNFNLHYFEFLFSLVDAYKKTADKKYLDKSVETINCWIDRNPQKSGGEGWASYTIALRLTNWLSYYSYVNEELDTLFKEKLLGSIHEQYAFLSRHLEKDILGNHYFEDLKALILCALFFGDTNVLEKALKAFHQEGREEILSDGMHFELSPMYHKLIFEGVIRVAAALRAGGRADEEIEQYLQPMLNVAWSLEEGLERIPLFNDCGNNVAKSLPAVMAACKKHFGISPAFKACLEDSGYYIFKQGAWKLIVDAGQPGPTYIPGHAHCDAGSFELFKEGKPVLVNCGTYAYQCKERDFFRSTAAHNTVMVNDTEQSQCWGTFRIARRSKTVVNSIVGAGISMTITDQKGKRVTRAIRLTDEKLIIEDQADGEKLCSYIHLENNEIPNNFCAFSRGEKIEERRTVSPYAVDYGAKNDINMLTYEGENNITVTFDLK